MSAKLKTAIILVGMGLLMAALPFGAEPHLVQKWKLLINGWLHKPADWLDFAFHGLPLIFAVAYTAFLLLSKKRASGRE